VEETNLNKSTETSRHFSSYGFHSARLTKKTQEMIVRRTTITSICT